MTLPQQSLTEKLAVLDLLKYEGDTAPHAAEYNLRINLLKTYFAAHPELFEQDELQQVFEHLRTHKENGRPLQAVADLLSDTQYLANQVVLGNSETSVQKLFAINLKQYANSNDLLFRFSAMRERYPFLYPDSIYHFGLHEHEEEVQSVISRLETYALDDILAGNTPRTAADNEDHSTPAYITIAALLKGEDMKKGTARLPFAFFDYDGTQRLPAAIPVDEPTAKTILQFAKEKDIIHKDYFEAFKQGIAILLTQDPTSIPYFLNLFGNAHADENAMNWMNSRRREIALKYRANRPLDAPEKTVFETFEDIHISYQVEEASILKDANYQTLDTKEQLSLAKQELERVKIDLKGLKINLKELKGTDYLQSILAPAYLHLPEAERLETLENIVSTDFLLNAKPIPKQPKKLKGLSYAVDIKTNIVYSHNIKRSMKYAREEAEKIIRKAARTVPSPGKFYATHKKEFAELPWMTNAQKAHLLETIASKMPKGVHKTDAHAIIAALRHKTMDYVHHARLLKPDELIFKEWEATHEDLLLGTATNNCVTPQVMYNHLTRPDTSGIEIWNKGLRLGLIYLAKNHDGKWISDSVEFNKKLLTNIQRTLDYDPDEARHRIASDASMLLARHFKKLYILADSNDEQFTAHYRMILNTLFGPKQVCRDTSTFFKDNRMSNDGLILDTAFDNIPHYVDWKMIASARGTRLIKKYDSVAKKKKAIAEKNK